MVAWTINLTIYYSALYRGVQKDGIVSHYSINTFTLFYLLPLLSLDFVLTMHTKMVLKFHIMSVLLDILMFGTGGVDTR